MGAKKIALVGNPNTGKSSIFNLLTGLHQRVGNFPGITVEKRTGTFTANDGSKIDLLDLPGTYSIFPRSDDEIVVFDVLTRTDHPDHPEAVIVVVDASNIERNLLLFTQLYDRGLPLILALTMEDVSGNKKMELDPLKFRLLFPGIPFVAINGRTGKGIDQLKELVTQMDGSRRTGMLSDKELLDLANSKPDQIEDAELRFKRIANVLKSNEPKPSPTNKNKVRFSLDRILLHPVAGYVIFFAVLFVIFQFIYRIASFPMEWIDGAFLHFSQWVKTTLPTGVFSDLIAEGVVPGIGGVLVFVPQIALLFFFLSLLEESGYMARVVFLMDKLVRPFGLNGKSVVPLMSSVACAIPGIMATRSINNYKERLITIMVAPMMSCSARIPVFTLLIALIVPSENVWGVFDLRGLVLLGLYGLGLLGALVMASIFKIFVKSKSPGFLIMEMPDYRFPRWRQVFIILWEKVRVFVFDAGKVIVAISIVLWALASYGPSQRMEKAIQSVEIPNGKNGLSQEDYDRMVSTVRLENSYIGIFGHAIEPAIAPLGYDWKIGISLITSFAAREVFVGSMAAIYSVGQDFDDNRSLLERMRAEKRTDNGQPVYSLAAGASLMVFYVFAMQCMATFAVVKRETHSWKWPLIQIVYMGILAYLGAWITFNFFI